MRKLNVFIGLCVGTFALILVSLVVLGFLNLLFRFLGEELTCILILACVILLPIGVTLGDTLEKIGDKVTSLFRK